MLKGPKKKDILYLYLVLFVYFTSLFILRGTNTRKLIFQTVFLPKFSIREEKKSLTTITRAQVIARLQ